MLALGGLLTCAAVLALLALAVLFRRPNPPRWTTTSLGGELVSVGLVCLFALGLATFVAGAVDAYREGLQPIDLGLLAAVLLATFVIWQRLDLGARFRAMEPASGGADAPRAGPPAAPASLPSAAIQPAPSQPASRVA